MIILGSLESAYWTSFSRTFFARCYGLRRYERISVQNRRFRSNSGWPNISGRRDTNHSFFSEN